MLNTNTLMTTKLLSVALLLLSFIGSASAKDNTIFDKKIATIEAEFNKKNGDYLVNLIDFKSLLELSFQDTDVDDNFKQGFSQGFSTQIKKTLGTQLFQHTPAEKGVKHFKTKHYGNRTEAFFRFDYGDNGYGYLRFILKNIEGEVKIIDWFDYATGQLYSSSINSIIISLAPRTGVIGKIKDLSDGKSKNLKLFLEFVNISKTKDIPAIKNFYTSNKPSLVKSWILMTKMMTIANESNDIPFYQEVLRDMEKHYASDTRASFMLLDHYFYQKQYLKVIPILENLEKEFDYNDAGILYLKSNTYAEANEVELAIKSAKQCIEVESDFENAYWNLVSMYIVKNEHSEAVNYLEQLRTTFGYLFEEANFVDEEFYAEFVKTEEFKQWITSFSVEAPAEPSTE